ncbi:uncharacterized protein BcabD6B2_50840 [Babesia caballi]|uniref:Uncharacterized protein n=1 Tax=Babesia caballi TaxID=5871 RepID=A0AAV4LZX1_BABCB|nr:hypothetical protein BcabD6B2_50840 [Babesia caballi]
MARSCRDTTIGGTQRCRKCIAIIDKAKDPNVPLDRSFKSLARAHRLRARTTLLTLGSQATYIPSRAEFDIASTLFTDMSAEHPKECITGSPVFLAGFPCFQCSIGILAVNLFSKVRPGANGSRRNAMRRRLRIIALRDVTFGICTHMSRSLASVQSPLMALPNTPTEHFGLSRSRNRASMT